MQLAAYFFRLLPIGVAALTAAGTAWVAAHEPLRNARAGEVLNVPVPHAVHSRLGPLREDRTDLIRHEHAPFPYDGIVPATGKRFIESAEDGKRVHKTHRGRILSEDEVFADNRVLLHIPGGFDIRRPGCIVVYFHGHGADLESDVLARQQLPLQLGLSGANAVLIAPQLAVKAADSSIGKLWQPGGFARLLHEASRNLAGLYGDRRAAPAFGRMPVVIVAYSGGYLAAAWSAHHGGVGRRLTGIVLLDALYGETDKLSDWISRNNRGFLISAYTPSTRRQNEAMQHALAARRLGHVTTLGPRITPGTIAFIDTGKTASHRDYVTEAWTSAPVSDVLARLPGIRRQVTARSAGLD